MYCGGLDGNFSLDFICQPLLDFLYRLKYCQTAYSKESEKCYLKYYMIFMKNKSEFLLVLNLKIDLIA